MPRSRRQFTKKSNVKPQPEEEGMFDQRFFLNPNEISEHLKCPICTDVFDNPSRAPCGHSFCQKCIMSWIKTNPICPVDRKPVQPHQMHNDFLVQNIIGDYMVVCPFRSLGCSFMKPLHLLKDHCRVCSFNPQRFPSVIGAIGKEVLENTSKDLEASRLNGILSASHNSNKGEGENGGATDGGDNSKSQKLTRAESAASNHLNLLLNDLEKLDEAEAGNSSDDTETVVPKEKIAPLRMRLYMGLENSEARQKDLCEFLENSQMELSTDKVNPDESAPKRRKK